MILEKVLSFYGINSGASILSYGNGLINTTWHVTALSGEYILQKINSDVFKNPFDIAYNIETIASYIKENNPDYFLVTPIKTLDNKTMVFLPEAGYFRCAPFIVGSRSYEVTTHPDQAFEAAFQFGLFTKSLKDLPVQNLKITIPGFHNLSFRYQHFVDALKHGNTERIKEAEMEIHFLTSQNHIVSTFEKIRSTNSFISRVTHHDTKINNVLFNAQGKSICVIDLDTVMPGYFISDLGDMMRTYLSPVNEEEKDFSKIEIRDEYFKAIIEGYMHSMHDALTPDELNHVVYAGMFLTYMQALRFLTDHLNNDIYYGARYEGQNYVRAQNQVTLLKNMLEKEEHLQLIVKKSTDVKFY